MTGAAWTPAAVFDFDRIRRDAFGDAPSGVILAALFKLAGPWRAQLEAHAATTLQIRIAMMLLPEASEHFSYNQTRALVEKHCAEFGVHFGPEQDCVVERIIELIEMVREADTGKRKSGWADLHYTEKAALLAQQNNRCLVCGRVLEVGGPFEARPEVDHVLPFALGGNTEANKRLICKTCNAAKGMNLTFVNSDFVAMNYFIKRRRRRTDSELRYWVFERDGSRCRMCGITSLSAKLGVALVRPEGRRIFDNLETRCEHCGGN